MSQRDINTESKLSGLDKAAIVMLSLSEDLAAMIVAKLDETEVRELSQRMALLGSVQAEVVEKILLEFTDRVANTGNIKGSFENTERLLSKVFDSNKVREIMDEIRGPAGRTLWDKLCNVDPDILASYLKNEYPQTVAVVMTKIRPTHAAQVFARLPEGFAMDVMGRMLRLEVVQRDILDEVENSLKSEFMSNLARTAQRDPHAHIAEVFNNFDRSTEGRFMQALEAKNAEAAERIKQLMFTFDDLVKLDMAGIQTLIRVVDKSRLALALKGANDTVRDLFLKNMSERAAKLLREDMQALGMVRIKLVDEAQQEIIVKTKELVQRGEITLMQGAEDEEMVG
ncbi:MAG: flagellar motor switch protein FliG [Holosporales bacterium]